MFKAFWVSSSHGLPGYQQVMWTEINLKRPSVQCSVVYGERVTRVTSINKKSAYKSDFSQHGTYCVQSEV